MIENWEFCNLLGIFRKIAFKVGLFNCRVAAYLNHGLERDVTLPLHTLSSSWALGTNELEDSKCQSQPWR
jgi:hypothetical protein